MISPLEVDLRGKLGPARDQGRRPTCLAHSVSASHELSLGSGFPLSPEYLHYFATGGMPSIGCRFEDATTALAQEGQPTERDCPYFADGPPANWRPPKGVGVYRRRSTVVQTSLSEVCDAVRGGRGPVLGISLPFEFFSPRSPWVIGPGDRIFGLHAVAAVGFGRTQNGRAVLVRNSWGESWGLKGHAFLSREFLARHFRVALFLS